jgi:hypothetical protein
MIGSSGSRIGSLRRSSLPANRVRWPGLLCRVMRRWHAAAASLRNMENSRRFTDPSVEERGKELL